MKAPRNIGPTLMLATALSLAVAATPRAGGEPSAAGAGFSASTDRGTEVRVAASRKSCKFGQRYSSYHRRCVFWSPFDFT